MSRYRVFRRTREDEVVSCEKMKTEFAFSCKYVNGKTLLCCSFDVEFVISLLYLIVNIDLNLVARMFALGLFLLEFSRVWYKPDL